MANLDLDSAQSPETVVKVLRNAAQRFYEDADELEVAWAPDIGAGKPWVMIARKLESCADQIEKALGK